MRAQQRLIGEIEAGRTYAARDHILAPFEEVLIVAVQCPAVREDQTRLALTPSSAAALHVVRGRRRNIPKVYEIEVCDIDTQLHRRRADHIGQASANLSLLAGVAIFPTKTPLPH